MLAFQINLSFFVLGALMIVAFLAGYMLRSYRIRQHREKIMELEKDMLNCHAQILDLEKEKSNLLHQMQESKIPVIPLKSPKDDENRKIK